MPRPPKYSDEELLDDLRQLAEKVGRSPPRKRDMNEYGKHGAKTYQDRWGSWSAAVEAAGFEPRAKGTHYAERPDTCPLCESEQTGLDFHHWRYGDEPIGCYLCRDCHDRIHEGKAATDNPNWLVHAVNNLIDRHMEHHGDPYEIEKIMNRYELPEIKPLVARAINNQGD